VQFGARLRLDDQLFVDNQIETLYSKYARLVNDPHRHLTSYAMSSRAELLLHGPHVKALDESEPERVVNLEERADNRVRQSLFDQLDMWHPVEFRDEANTKSSNSRHQDPSQSEDDPKHQSRSEASV